MERNEAAIDRRRVELRRMRLFATLLLVAMAVLFVAASIAAKQYSWAGYVKAFAEAGMVGACADWFAVTALFRHPLGLPIPHTKIIPRNKQRIGDSLGRFIADNFLSRGVLAARLAEIDVMRWGANWLRNLRHGKRVGRQLQVLLPKIVESLPKEQTVELLAQISQAGLQALPAAPLASKILSILWAQSETQALIDRAIDIGQTNLMTRRDFIRRKVSENSSRLIPKWVDSQLSDKVVAGLISTLDEMRSPKHPWRGELRTAVEKLIADLTTDPGLYARGEQIKADILANRLVRDQINRLCQDIEASITTGVTAKPAAITASVEATFAGIGRWLDENEKAKEQINIWLRRAAVRLLMPRRAAIGTYVSGVVADWDSTTLIDKLELQVGRDLQYIRINGTLIGGLVGLAIYGLSRWTGLD